MSIAASLPKLDDLVAAHIRHDFVAIRKSDSVGEALETIRRAAPSGDVWYIYVADEAQRLCGVLPVRRLLQSAESTPIAEIMIHPVAAIPETATVLDACEYFTLHRLLAFPVVDPQHRIRGVIDIKLYTDELEDIERQQRRDDLFQLIGVHAATARGDSASAAFRARFPWLLCNLAAGMVAAGITAIFGSDIEKTVALAAFIPVVLALAESVSVQSVSLSLQIMQGRRPTWAAAWRAVRTELMTGLFLGVATGGLVALGALAGWRLGGLAVCLWLAIAVGVTWAAVVGVSLPVLLRLARRDPRLASGPMALALADLATLTLYLGLAHLLL